METTKFKVGDKVRVTKTGKIGRICRIDGYSIYLKIDNLVHKIPFFGSELDYTEQTFEQRFQNGIDLFINNFSIKKWLSYIVIATFCIGWFIFFVWFFSQLYK